MATIRKQLLASNTPVITTLGGDFLSPSALGTALVDGAALAGRQMVAVLNATGLDWATLGNHEFDIPEQLFRARLAESRFGYVVSNVTDTLGGLFPGTVTHAIVQVGGAGRSLRLGLVGAVIPANRVPWVRYEDPVQAVRRHASMIRDSVDVLIAITHLYYYQDARLAQEVPELDLILGGHEHENFLLRRGPRRIPIVKSDGNVRSVQVVTVTRSQRDGVKVTTELVPVTDSIAEDPEVKRVVDSWLDRAFAGYIRAGFAPREIVTTLREPLEAREVVIRSGETNMTEAMLAAMKREAPDAEVGLFNAGSMRIDDVIPAGPITQYDVIRILPFGGPLIGVDIRGDVLERVIRAGRRNVGGGGYLQMFGAAIDGERVLIDGRAVDPGRSYRVVTTDFLLTGREANLDFLNRSNPAIINERVLRDVRMPLMEELRDRNR